ncbi:MULTISPECIES: LolA family protein [unclassified Sphingomonas]|uniref:LolA family protein n=1 Tax=unclassified Sphingomonas TaxID=196159 RepID=UPI002150CAE9|nr:MULTISPECIES: outer membrane lipoprotein carrier protein LolA [unclassified Sphingomonas]MCR5870388.1 outer membrane lipoprotein carrier protein LolA [Sphingomonas sp. J344]UUY01273.1 outer membrane lipoprotein carrier protein LolA [Sphingomonas sp. J315]
MMFRPLAAVAALTLALPAAAQQGTLAQVQQHLRATQSMTAAFSQTDRTGKTLNGTMTLKKPGKIRFQYEKGVPLLIVADGSSLWFIDYSVRQVQRWPVKDSPLGILMNPDRDAARYAKVVPTGNPDVISVEARDPKRPEYGRITMVFARNASAPGGLMLQGWVALDAQNNRTTVRLSNQRFNAPVSDGAFRWNDPRKTGGRR